MYSIGEILNRTVEHLQKKGLENSRLNAELLLGHVLDFRRIDLYLHFDRSLGEKELQAYRDLIRRRLAGVPLQYLTGRTQFFSLDFEVRSGVLIPRPETEILVDAVLECLRPNEGDLRVADVGTGCGNIAIALAVHLPRAHLWATDRSPEALSLAEINAGKHGVSDRIHFFQGDLFAPLHQLADSLSVVVSNPPYVSADDLERLPIEIRDHEPVLALDGGAGGLDVISRMVKDAPGYLVPGGWLALEVGDGQAQTVAGLMASCGSYHPARLVRDYSGIDRVVLACRCGQSDDR